MSFFSPSFFGLFMDVFWTRDKKTQRRRRRKEQQIKEERALRERESDVRVVRIVRSFVVMTRYYCEYCDAYLTHDSATVRRQHISGFKHKANVRNYYLQFMNNNTACGPAQQQQGAQLGPAAGMPTGANQMMPPMGPPMTMGQQQPQQNAMPPPKY